MFCFVLYCKPQWCASGFVLSDHFWWFQVYHMWWLAKNSGHPHAKKFYTCYILSLQPQGSKSYPGLTLRPQLQEASYLCIYLQGPSRWAEASVQCVLDCSVLHLALLRESSSCRDQAQGQHARFLLYYFPLFLASEPNSVLLLLYD